MMHGNLSDANELRKIAEKLEATRDPVQTELGQILARHIDRRGRPNPRPARLDLRHVHGGGIEHSVPRGDADETEAPAIGAHEGCRRGEQQILDTIKTQGRASIGASVEQLALVTKQMPETIRGIIHHLRVIHGLPICCNINGLHYWPGQEADLDDTVQVLRARQREIEEAIHSIEAAGRAGWR